MFYWPRDGPSLKKCFGDDLEGLDFLRTKHHVYVYVQPDLVNFLCVASDEKFDQREMTERLRALWRQKFARFEIRVKLYMVQPPQRDQTADKVAISKTSGVAQPVLYTSQLGHSSSQNGSLQQRVAEVSEENNKRLRNNLLQFLSLVKYVDSDMKISVKFGTFVFDRWKSTNGIRTLYPLREFPEMLMDERWQGRLVPG